MSERAGAATRSGRAARTGLRRVAVTGATGPVARLLVERLLADPGVEGVVAVGSGAAQLVGAGGAGQHSPAAAGAQAALRVVEVDSLDPAVAAAFAGCDVVVHLDPDPVRQQLPEPGPDSASPTRGDGPSPDAVDGSADGAVQPDPREDVELVEPVPVGRAVRAAQTVLTAAAAAGVGTVVLVTSAMVYGTRRDPARPLAEDDPPAAAPMGRLLRDLLEIEHVAETARRTHPGLAVAVLRPAALVGPGVDTLITRHFEAPRLLTVRGVAMRWQFCHLQDLIGALLVTALRPLAGPLTVGCTGWLAQDEVERLSGLGRVELPESLAFGTAERLHRLGLTPAPAGELSFVTRPWVVPATRLRDAGWRPTWDNADAFGVLLTEARGRVALAGRRIGLRETATLGAAGATVAVLGTAAIVRRARRARRRG